MAIIKFERAFLLLLIQQDAGAYNTFYLQTVDIFFRYLMSNFFLSREQSEHLSLYHEQSSPCLTERISKRPSSNNTSCFHPKNSVSK
jgi:hypothetical protein